MSKPKLNSSYICVKNMKRAIDFYEKFLERKVSVRDELFSIFEVDRFFFYLFNNKKAKEKVTYGDNCLLSFEVENIKQVQEKLKKLGVKIVYPLTKIGKNLVLEFKDPEGNDVEVYSIINSS